MYQIEVTGNFSAAHQLRGYQGKCENLHGHNWMVSLTLEANQLDATGLAIDFREAKKLLKPVLEELDHTLLNQHPQFRERNPTSENIASFIAKRVSGEIPGVKVVSVAVWESPGSKAVYYPD